ncbi:MAG: dihydroorotase [Anaerovoracaceae bacterium]
MKVIIKNCIVNKKKADIYLEDGVVSNPFNNADKVLDCTDIHLLPGLADIHVHFREPGFSYKESIGTGTDAAVAGGFTAVCTMPNLNPVPDSIENLAIQQEIIKTKTKISVYPLASITEKQEGKTLVNFKNLKENGAIAFSDDGKGIQSDALMKKAMKEVRKINGIIVAHCEDESLLDGGYIHKGVYAEKNNHMGISSASEYRQLERDIDLMRKTGCTYHVCHISTKESVELIRQAKSEGLPITCETAPHYLWLCDEDISEDGRYKMNPPIRSKEDRNGLIEGIVDGTIDCIATDHAPHSKEEKARGLKKSLFGVVGLETAFSACYSALVKTKKITLEKLIDLMCYNPRKIFNLESAGNNIGDKANFCLVDLNEKWRVKSENFLSKGRATPFTGIELTSKVKGIILGDQVLYDK